jgi:hypothetical protein
MAKSSNKEPLSPLFLSTRAIQEEAAHPPNQPEEMDAQPATPPIYRALQRKDRSTPTLGDTQARARAFWSIHDYAHRMDTHPSGHAYL